MKTEFIKSLTNGLDLEQINQIKLLRLKHNGNQALISLQGGQLLSWQPAGSEQDVLWLSEVEPFEAGTAIRGGVPVCYPWFGGVKSPSHGYARLQNWALSHYELSEDYAYLELSLLDSDQLVEAKLEFIFDAECRLIFTHYGKEEAQVALHSYFKVANIADVSVHGLPESCFDSLTKQDTDVPSPRTIGENVDCIYRTENSTQLIDDKQRQIEVEHSNNSDVVLWNPWHKPTSGMSETGYQTMLCLETARINQPLSQGETVEVVFRLK